jgi:predicted pyridoxine 5'-phosphate oxidase superfamily flavin-nucleotide-binding protein
MGARYLDIAITPAVAAAQAEQGSAKAYADRLEALRTEGPIEADELGPAEAEFLAGRDGFYLGTVSATGWPYIQYRGGPRGFLKVLDAHRVGFADFRGNRQYLTVGNLATDDRVSLFVMDYAQRRRLKLFGHAAPVDPAADDTLARRLVVPDYEARIERLVVITVEGFNWNCPQHITRRFDEPEVAAALIARDQRIAELTAELERLRGTPATP